MILRVHLDGAAWYTIGDEIWEVSLESAIRQEAELIAGYAGADLLDSLGRGRREALRQLVEREMASALESTGDTYIAPDGVSYSLCDESAVDPMNSDASLGSVQQVEPVVEKVIKFEDLPLGSLGSRRVIVRWSDGTEDEAMRWYSDEVLVCEGDHGNSRLMSPRIEMPARAGSTSALRDP